MTTWVLKESQHTYPYDLICVRLDEGHLLFIHEDGHHDVQDVDSGLPTLGAWWEFE